MASLNKVTLGADPDARATDSGKQVVTFSLATSEKWKDKQTGEYVEKTEWHRVVVFNDRIADVLMQYARKGSKVYLEGKLQTRKWTDKDGVERYTTEVVLPAFGAELKLLSKATATQEDAPPQTAADARELDDEIPF
jgi:single-strand DNA-binding protein